MSENRNSIITTADLRKSQITWLMFSCTSNNWERMQNLTFALTMAPILKKLYPNDNDAFAQRLTSHMEFYNTQPTLGCLVNGIVIAMEEEKSLKNDIPDEAISGLKSGMMGPLAGIGDSVMNSLIHVILMSIGLTLAFQGNILGPIIYLITWIPISLGVSWGLTKLGYKMGVNSLSLMSGNTMGRIVEALTQIGLIVIGGVSATYVSLKTILTIPGVEGTDPTSIQAIIDGILPNLLPLGLVIGCYWLLVKKKMNPTTLILVLFVGGTLLALVGVI